MLITCPICGPRDLREFTVKGAALAMPSDPDWSEAWHDYLHLRENPAGVTRELWQHTGGCGAWLVVTRNTITHAILHVELASEAVYAD
ncbi:MAG: sarcosine oxidase subunit delta [Pseudomonadota bacterium]